MQIKISLKIFLFIIIFCITRQIEIYGLLMLFAFLHEMGHLIMGMILKFTPSKLEINPCGLAISFNIHIEDFNQKIKKSNILSLKKLIVALAGPTVNFTLALIYMLFNIKFCGIEREHVVYSNILIGIFNLMPIYPLDGGRALKNFLKIMCGIKKSYRLTFLVSNISIIILTMFVSIVILYVKNISIVLIMAYLWYLVFKENSIYFKKMRLYKILEKEILNSR